MKLFVLGLTFLTVAILARENYLWLTWVCCGGLVIIVDLSGWDHPWEHRMQKTKE